MGSIGIDVGLSNPSDATVTATINLSSLLGGNSSDFIFAPQTQLVFSPGQVRQRVVVGLMKRPIARAARKDYLPELRQYPMQRFTPDPNRFRAGNMDRR